MSTRIYIKRQLRKLRFRLSRKRQNILLSHHDGEYFAVFTSDRIISRRVYLRGNFEFWKVEKALALLGREFQLDHLVDVGANIGTVCIPAVRRGLARRATAIEPAPDNYRLLIANIYLNDLASAIKTHNVALVAGTERTVGLALSARNSGDHRAFTISSSKQSDADHRDHVVVSADTFDNLIPDLDPRSSLVWMDTQGYEGFILSAAHRITSQCVPMVVEFWPQAMRRSGCYDQLKSALMGYKTFYNLNSQRSAATAMSAAALDELTQRLSGPEDQTDLLIV